MAYSIKDYRETHSIEPTTDAMQAMVFCSLFFMSPINSWFLFFLSLSYFFFFHTAPQYNS